MASVRLTKEQEQRLEELARQKEVSRSYIIKEALEAYLVREEALPYELGKHVFGNYGSKDSDRSATYKERVKESLRKKHNHGRRRP